jgi:hypothetical protein
MLRNVQFLARSYSAPSRVFANFNIFRDTAMMDVKPLPPTMAAIPPSGESLKVERQGTMLFSFVPSTSGDGNGYNWSDKQHFALSVVECGDLLTAKREFDFYHNSSYNPQAGNADPAQGKSLAISPIAGSEDLSFSYSAGDVKISLPMTPAEYRVLQSLINFSIPKLLAWDAIFEPSLAANTREPEEPRYKPPAYGAQGDNKPPVTPLKQGSNIEGEWPF